MTWISADFPFLASTVSNKVSAGTTTRKGGVSAPPFDSLNVATHVQDDKKSVIKNREILKQHLALPTEPFWLNQVHSDTVIEVPQEYLPNITADASYTHLKQQICAAMTADCLPLLLVDSKGTEVAAVHAGWRGLANGLIGKTIKRFVAQPHSLHVFLGPAIGPQSFEVGQEVVDIFIALDSQYALCFEPVDGHKERSSNRHKKYLANIYGIAKHQLESLGVRYISGGELCTYNQPELFYSYRRDGQTGRMVSLIWLN